MIPPLSTLPPTCTCPSPGYCLLFQREMVGRSYEICRGTSGLDPTIRDEYRLHWQQQAGAPYGLPPAVQAQIDNLTASQLPCGYRGKVVRHEDCGCVEPQAIYECDNGSTNYIHCVVNRKGNRDYDAQGYNVCSECTYRDPNPLLTILPFVPVEPR